MTIGIGCVIQSFYRLSFMLTPRINWSACLFFALLPMGLPAADKPVHTVKTTEDIVFISHDQLQQLGLKNHDCTMPIIPAENGAHFIYLSEGGAKDGKHSNVFRLRTDLTTYDPASIQRVPFSDVPAAEVNDLNGWKIWLSYLYEIGGGEILAIVHLEDQDAGSKECFRMGMAYSNDGGRSFKFRGFIASPHLADQDVKTGEGEGKVNIAGGGLRWDGTYFYLYISDISLKDRSDRRIAITRAPMEKVIRAARAGGNAVWSKYYNGGWDEHAIGGNSSSLGSLVEYHSSVAYNTYLKQWLTFSRKDGYVIMRRSPDPMNFDVPDERVFKLPDDSTAAYFTTQPIEGKGPELGRAFYVFFRTDHGDKQQRIFDTLRLTLKAD